MSIFSPIIQTYLFRGILGLPDSGGVAVTVSGMPIFPLFNNRVLNSNEECEIDNCNAHAGKGYDYHYHGDPFHPNTGTCMYSPADYSVDYTHPPLISKSNICNLITSSRNNTLNRLVIRRLRGVWSLYLQEESWLQCCPGCVWRSCSLG